MFEIIFILFVSLIIVLLIVGLVSSLRWIVKNLKGAGRSAENFASGTGSNERSTGSLSGRTQSESPPQPTLEADLRAARRLLEYLRATEKISALNYTRMTTFLDDRLGDGSNVRLDTLPIPSPANGPANPLDEISIVEIPEAELVGSDVSERDVTPPRNVSELMQAATTAASVHRPVVRPPAQSVAPWDRPDPPTRPPRRSFGEMMSGFMQEKNMRWGELTSGILIVLSAVGLVVSLRDELSDAIPYFSSILFMLITGAIIGAGIYTLKKWKLRNTSRGTLVIGLCLIPLNFVAACVLSGGETRRELDDVWLWVALLVGIGGFGALSWYASRFLLRKQNWQLVVALVGCGAGTILLNRLASVTNSSPQVWLLSLPVMLSFLVGAGTFERRWATKDYWSARGSNRLYLRLGISTFALLSAISILLIRSETKIASAIAITPVLVLVGLTGSWLGSRLRKHRGAGSGQAIIGTTLQTLGLVIGGVVLLASLSNPSVFAVNCVLAAAGLAVMSWESKSVSLLPLVWALACGAVLIGLNLINGRFQFDQWTSGLQLQNALVNGQSGLCLLACGLVAAGAQSLIAKRFANLELAQSTNRAGWLTGGGILLAGCAIAVLASFLHRDNVFDTTTASCLLLLAGLGGLVGVVWLGRWPGSEVPDSLEQTSRVGTSQVSPIQPLWLAPERLTNWLSYLGSGLLLLGLVHALLWNPTGQNLFLKISQNVVASWVWVLALQALLLRGLLLIGMADEKRSDALVSLSHWSSLASVVLVTGLVIARSSGGVMTELVSNVGVDPFLLLHHGHWVVGAIAIVIFAIVAIAVPPQIGSHIDGSRMTVWIGAALLVLWLLAWSAGALPFEESKSMASAVRWLLPIGGLVAAVAWLILSRWEESGTHGSAGMDGGKQRLSSSLPRRVFNQLQLRSESSGRSIANQLIDFSLALVVLTVLLISTVTVSRVMLYGGESLGGPEAGSWFANMDKVISFGGPLALVVSSFLVYAISQQRSWLATAGSLVFQYMVLLAVVLLFLSPHPKLASAWFVRVLQSMSLGMTLYGFAWWAMRKRIAEGRALVSEEGLESPNPPSGFTQPSPSLGSSSKWLSQIETHTLINGLLVTSLAVLVFGRFFVVPDQPGDWINSVGSLLGVGAWVLFAGLAFTVWREKLWQQRSAVGWLGLAGWMGLVLVGMIGAVVDYNLQTRGTPVPWLVFKVLAAGTVATAIGQVIGLSRMQVARRAMNDWLEWPIYLTTFVGVLFAVRGGFFAAGSWAYFVMLLAAMVGLLFGVGGLVRRSRAMFLSGLVAMVGAAVLVSQSSWGVFSGTQPRWINLSAILVTLLALANLVVYWLQSKSRRLNEAGSTEIVTGVSDEVQSHSARATPAVSLSNLWPNVSSSLPNFSNVVLILGAIWLSVGSLLQVICSSELSANASVLANPLGVGVLSLTIVLLGASLWNDGRKFWVASLCLASLGAVITLAAVVAPTDESRAVGVLFGCAVVVALGGLGWAQRERWLAGLKQLGAPFLVRLERQLSFQLPVFSYLMIGLLVLLALLAIVNVEARGLRYLTAAVPLVLAVGMGSLASASGGYLQRVRLALGLLALGALLLSWADLPRAEMFAGGSLSLLVRSLLVLAGAMFVYGFLVARWVRFGDRWLQGLREMAGVMCGLAIVCLAWLIAVEASRFTENVGCGISIAEAWAVAVMVMGMVIGLISIAVRPQVDPFALSLHGRQAYVYVAQAVVAGLVAHLYFSMPWLFKFGIKEYWPYLAMVICFGGVGVAHLLEQRKLTVLGQPLFMTAAILPMLIAAAIFAIDSRASGELVLLLVGLAYVMISYTHRSWLAGVGAIVFGNLALWMFYSDLQSFGFQSHPQLWLIPPAVSVLIAGQLNRERLTKSQLAMLRYLCLAVIYVSSTSEIFISGLGNKLWPPVILAALAVAGIMLGIMLQIRSFLYLGSLFLLMAMLTMVAHAAKGLDHVWPWWAFGITLGIAILVMFGLFEKKKNQMKEITGRLQEWDS